MEGMAKVRERISQLHTKENTLNEILEHIISTYTCIICSSLPLPNELFYHCNQLHVTCEDCTIALMIAKSEEPLDSAQNSLYARELDCSYCRSNFVSKSDDGLLRFLKDILEKIDYKCGNAFCNAKVKPEHRADHEEMCDHLIIKCPFNDCKNPYIKQVDILGLSVSSLLHDNTHFDTVTSTNAMQTWYITLNINDLINVKKKDKIEILDCPAARLLLLQKKSTANPVATAETFSSSSSIIEALDNPNLMFDPYFKLFCYFSVDNFELINEKGCLAMSFFWASNSIMKTSQGKKIASDCFSVKCFDFALGTKNYLSPIKYVSPRRKLSDNLPVIERDNTIFLHFSDLYGCKKRFETFNSKSVCKQCKTENFSSLNDSVEITARFSPSLLSPKFDSASTSTRKQCTSINPHFHIQIQQKRFPINVPRTPSPLPL